MPSPDAADEIEVVDLAGLNVGPADFVTRAVAAPAVRLIGAEAQNVLSLWRSLPPGRQARCHTPPYGLRFYAGGVVVYQASICWHCNNIFGEAGGQDLHCEFDGRSPAAQELLASVRKAVGGGAVG